MISNLNTKTEINNNFEDEKIISANKQEDEKHEIPLNEDKIEGFNPFMI